MTLHKNKEKMSEKRSMIELADLILGNRKSEMAFKELYEEVANTKQLNDRQRSNLLARFYTDLNVDGRFMPLGSNVWGLKRWYPAKQTTEKSLAESRKRELEEVDIELKRIEEQSDEDMDEEDEGKLGYYEESGFDAVEEE